MGEVVKFPNCRRFPRDFSTHKTPDKKPLSRVRYWSAYCRRYIVWFVKWTLTRWTNGFWMTSGFMWRAILPTATAQRSRQGVLRLIMDKPEAAINRRSTGDRRSQYRPTLKFFPLRWPTQVPRRDQDKKDFIYVDQYHPWLLVAILLLVILSISDALLTLKSDLTWGNARKSLMGRCDPSLGNSCRPMGCLKQGGSRAPKGR